MTGRGMTGEHNSVVMCREFTRSTLFNEDKIPRCVEFRAFWMIAVTQTHA